MFSQLRQTNQRNGDQSHEFGHSELIRNIGAALVFLMIFTAIVSAYTLREGTIKEWSKQLENLTLVLADGAEQILSAGKSGLQRLKKDIAQPLLSDDDHSLDSASVRSNQIKQFAQVNPMIEATVILDAKGLVIQATDNFTVLQKNKIAQDIRSAHQKNPSGEILYNLVHQDTNHRSTTLFLSQRIQSPSGEFLGILGIGLSTNLFLKVYERLSADEPQSELSVALYGADGALISASPSAILVKAKEDQLIPSANYQDNKEFSISMQSINASADEEQKVNYLIATRKIPSFPFYVKVQIPENLYLSNWIINVRWIWITAALSLALVIIFELLLLKANRTTNQELIGRIHAQQELKQAHDLLEERVQERTQELTAEITVRKLAQEELAQMNTQIAEVSHRAGMAQVANSVLHNIGNVLNSLNVSISTMKRQVKESPLFALPQISNLLEANKNQLASFLTQDEKGAQVPKLIQLLSHQWEVENTSLSSEIDQLRSSVQHINEIINKQQSLSGQIGLKESINLKDIIYSALSFHQSAFMRSKIGLEIQVPDNLNWTGDRNKLTQILLNLIVNAEESLTSAHQSNNLIVITALTKPPDGQIEISIQDNGVGIDTDTLHKLFRYGFTTKPYGHGFGLHASALAAQEMGGSLKAYSEGKGHGATFRLTISPHQAS